MKQIRTFLMVALPSLLAGGLLFGGPGGAAQADDGRAVSGFWPVASGPIVVVPARPRPVPPVPPLPPLPPGGVSVTMHDGKIVISGLRELVQQQLAEARAKIAAQKDLSPKLRAKLEKHLAKVQEKLDKRLAKLDASNIDELGEQAGELGAIISEEMEGLGEELGSDGASWGEQVGKNFARSFGQGFAGHGGDGTFHWDTSGGDHDGDDHDDDDDHASPHPDPHPHPNPHPTPAHGHVHVDVDSDDDATAAADDAAADDATADADDAIAALGDAALTGAQRAEIVKLRADTERQIAAAQADVARLSESLRQKLANPDVTDAEVASAVDAISSKEAAIRKARILAWVTARRVLDASQRSRIEGAARHHR